jgi:hypothetical protein
VYKNISLINFPPNSESITYYSQQLKKTDTLYNTNHEIFNENIVRHREKSILRMLEIIKSLHNEKYDIK